MKFIKYLLIMTAVFLVELVYAKRTGAVPVQITSTPTITQPVIQPVIQPTLQQQSYANALTIIKDQMRPDQVLQDNQFTDQFINFVKNSVKNSGDNASIFAKALLEAGAYLHVAFMNEQVINLTIISDLNDEINRQMKAMQLPVQQPSKITKAESTKVTMHLVPTDASILKNYNLCPLFGQEGGLYFAFNPKARLYSGEIVARFEGENVDKNASCIVSLGKFGAWNRTLMQLKTLNQFDPIISTKFSAAMCAGLSLNNGRLIRKYALEGKPEYLRQLHDMNEATQFLRNFKIGDWLNAAVVRANIKNLKDELGIDGVDASAISTVSLFDANLDKKFGFGIFDEDEFIYVQTIKKNIQKGFQQDNYMHVMIIGNEEIVEGALGHYFCFAIIKRGNEIQYIVLDTIPRAYHLQEGSHERDRLMFVIDNIERNASDIKVENIRIKRLQMLEEERLQSLKK